MSSTHATAIAAVICVVGAAVSYQIVPAAESETVRADWEPGFEQGSTHYQNKETDKAIAAFKDALSKVFPDVGVEIPKTGEQTLRSLFDDEQTAAMARYQLALIYESQGKPEAAAILLRDALTIVSVKDAHYLGYNKGCKSCHYKEWKSWKNTKMAKAFEALKPGASAEIKLKFNFDPKKDYTEDPNCLACHTTGFGLPGGYQIPGGAGYKVREASKQTEGGTCEACHGPGSKYAPVHQDVDDRARKYRQEEFYAAGEHRVDSRICTRCHNARNPTAGPDYHFDFKEHKEKDTHENFPLKYRLPNQTPSADGK